MSSRSTPAPGGGGGIVSDRLHRGQSAVVPCLARADAQALATMRAGKSNRHGGSGADRRELKIELSHSSTVSGPRHRYGPRLGVRGAHRAVLPVGPQCPEMPSKSSTASMTSRISAAIAIQNRPRAPAASPSPAPAPPPPARHAERDDEHRQGKDERRQQPARNHARRGSQLSTGAIQQGRANCAVPAAGCQRAANRCRFRGCVDFAAAKTTMERERPVGRAAGTEAKELPMRAMPRTGRAVGSIAFDDGALLALDPGWRRCRRISPRSKTA